MTTVEIHSSCPYLPWFLFSALEPCPGDYSKNLKAPVQYKAEMSVMMWWTPKECLNFENIIIAIVILIVTIAISVVRRIVRTVIVV